MFFQLSFCISVLVLHFEGFPRPVNETGLSAATMTSTMHLSGDKWTDTEGTTFHLTIITHFHSWMTCHCVHNSVQSHVTVYLLWLWLEAQWCHSWHKAVGCVLFLSHVWQSCGLFQTYVIEYPIYSIHASAKHKGVIFIVTPMPSDKRSGRWDFFSDVCRRSGLRSKLSVSQTQCRLKYFQFNAMHSFGYMRPTKCKE